MTNSFKVKNFVSSVSPKSGVKKYLPAFIVIACAIVTVFFFIKFLSRISSSSTSNSINSDGRVQVANAIATMPLGKEFSFPLKDGTGKKITDVKFVLDNIEQRNEIIVNGKRANAIQGRTFLVMSLKITSNYTRGLQINSKDYFRLSANGNESDLLAPDINNDPVIVEPTSTKLTRLGWPINDSDKNLVLLVGEIGGEKTKIEINLNK